MSKSMLHIGCGPIKLPGFINIDIEEKHKPDMVMDCLKLRDFFNDDSIDGIFSCHHMEHLEWHVGVQKFLNAVYCVLKPHGVLRIVVPDLGLIARKYVNGEDLKDVYDGDFYTYKDLPATRFLWWARGWEHTVLFDEQLLRYLLLDAGYREIKVMPFNMSRMKELCGHDRFQTESLCIECIK